MKSKQCPGCEQTLAITAFSKDARRRDGLQCYCRACQKTRRPSKAAEAARVREYRKRPGSAEKNRQRCREYHAKNREACIARARQWRAANPEATYAAVKTWRAANPEQTLAMNHAYRARRMDAEGEFSAQEWIEKCAAYSDCCAYCHKAVKLTVQHVIPLTRSGSNRIANIVPACATCNSRIGNNIVIPPEPVPS